MNPVQADPSHSILIVEDYPEDFETTVRAFRKSGLANPIRHVENGNEALDHAKKSGRNQVGLRSENGCMEILAGETSADSPRGLGPAANCGYRIS